MGLKYLTRSQYYKTFYECKLQIFVISQSVCPCLVRCLWVSPGAYPRNATPERRFTRVGFSLARKHQTRLERIARNKPSSLLQKAHGRKKFYNICPSAKVFGYKSYKLKLNQTMIQIEKKKSFKNMGCRVRLGQVRIGQDRLGQVRIGQDRLGQVRIGQDRSGQSRLGQAGSIIQNILFKRSRMRALKYEPAFVAVSKSGKWQHRTNPLTRTYLPIKHFKTSQASIIKLATSEIY